MKEYKEIVSLLEKGPLYLITVIDGPHIGEKLVLQGREQYSWNPELDSFWQSVQAAFRREDCPCRFQAEGTLLFAERLVQEPELVICGGGHVSLELSTLADYMEYPYTVIDDREEFANRERFPNAKECICQSFDQAFKEHTFPGNVYYIIVTRGHAHDLQCLEAVLNRSYGYVGMIGSRGKVKKTMDLLTEKGYPAGQLSEVHAPIGIRIGGQTPKEIAVSILAQLIEVKNSEQPSSYVDDGMKELLQSDRDMVLARIIEKKGSAPRGVGSRMLVDRDGIAGGTIGGGKIEFEAEKRAKQLAIDGGSMIESYRLDTESAGSLGMWCGGEVTVFFEH